MSQTSMLLSPGRIYVYQWNDSLCEGHIIIHNPNICPTFCFTQILCMDRTFMSFCVWINHITDSNHVVCACQAVTHTKVIQFSWKYHIFLTTHDVFMSQNLADIPSLFLYDGCYQLLPLCTRWDGIWANFIIGLSSPLH